ncbi:hypothetical protein [Halobacillus halophilus]|uniref:hypothetical protein n=1 Tax=Halobacillus halophilus TaxID=1570 RepID=UPI001CD7ACF3|nr:hypothetical protein [Halobacillus halophilus]MCA1011786.1 hypothetical protein [Halobacillus halophilus]
MRIKTILFVLFILAVLPGCSSEVPLYDYDRSSVFEVSDKLPENAKLPEQLPFKAFDVQVSNDMVGGGSVISFINEHNSVLRVMVSDYDFQSNNALSYESEPLKISDDWRGEYIVDAEGHSILWKEENLYYRLDYHSFSSEDDLSREQVLQVIRQFEPLP